MWNGSAYSTRCPIMKNSKWKRRYTRRDSHYSLRYLEDISLHFIRIDTSDSFPMKNAIKHRKCLLDRHFFDTRVHRFKSKVPEQIVYPPRRLCLQGRLLGLAWRTWQSSAVRWAGTGTLWDRYLGIARSRRFLGTWPVKTANHRASFSCSLVTEFPSWKWHFHGGAALENVSGVVNGCWSLVLRCPFCAEVCQVIAGGAVPWIN